MKKLLKEIVIITLIASLIAIAYNLFNSKPLPWVFKPKEIVAVHDTELTVKKTQEQKFDTTIVADTVVRTDSEKVEVRTDTSIIVEKEIPQNKNNKIEENTEQSKKLDNEESLPLKTLNYEQVLKNIDNSDFLFVDARHKDEWEKAKIGNAVNIVPPYEGDVENYFKKLMALPHDKIIVVYCTGGSCEASHRVATDLKSIGYERVFLYSGGWDDWTKKRGL